MLQMKKGEHPANLPRRRDLWVEAHGCKLVMRMLGAEYERAADEAVPGSQGGFTRFKAAPGRTLILRAQKEQCEAEHLVANEQSDDGRSSEGGAGERPAARGEAT